MVGLNHFLSLARVVLFVLSGCCDAVAHWQKVVKIVKVLSKGKTACTKFSRISTNGTHSIVSCEPVTGRTHQIRVHLQFTGHPIANDKLYLSESVNHPSVEGLGADRAAAMSEFALKPNHCEICVPNSTDDTVEDFCIDPMCTNCFDLAPKGYDGYDDGLWLHCVGYSGQTGHTSAHILIGLLWTNS